MKYILGLWALPMGIFWSWFVLSANDMSFGYTMLSRQVHDLVFKLYGEMLGIDAASIPGLVARACVFDTFLLLAIVAFRRRNSIMAWVQTRRSARYRSDEPSSPKA